VRIFLSPRRKGAKNVKELLSGQRKARPADGFMLADGTAAGAGEAVPFFEDKAAVSAHRRDDLEMQAGPRGSGEVREMLHYLSFREGEKL
jgi:hypothetical protein